MTDALKDDPAYHQMLNEIADSLRGIKEMCRQHGIFDGLRELFSCRNCGLLESVDFDGRLMTYHGIDDLVDTGLRFPEPDAESRSVCPECGAVVVLEEEGMDC